MVAKHDKVIIRSTIHNFYVQQFLRGDIGQDVQTSTTTRQQMHPTAAYHKIILQWSLITCFQMPKYVEECLSCSVSLDGVVGYLTYPLCLSLI